MAGGFRHVLLDMGAGNNKPREASGVSTGRAGRLWFSTFRNHVTIVETAKVDKAAGVDVMSS